MPQTRLFVPGLSHHVVQRGTNRCTIFTDDEDCRVFMYLLEQAATLHNIAVHAFALMKTHFHLLVTAGEETGLSRMMRRVGCRYVLHFNARHDRSGALWQGRYRASLIETPDYWLSCMRYIEMNPVRAELVVSAADYRWSSYGAHARAGSGREWEFLASHPLYDALGPSPEDREAHWRAFCAQDVGDDEIGLFRASINHGWTTAAAPSSNAVVAAS
jgi:putative transposase